MNKLIARGRTAEIYNWEEGKILKLYFDWCSDGMIEAEVIGTRLAQEAGLPVAHLYDIQKISGRTGLVQQRVDGSSMLQQLMKFPEKVTYYGQLLASLHHKIHQIKAERLEFFGERIQNTVNNLLNIPDEWKNAVKARIAGLEHGFTFCHGDFHTENVVITMDGPFIMDWMTACCGSPATDVARTLMILTAGEAPFKGLTKLKIEFLRNIFVKSYLKEYLKLSGENPGQIKAWRLPILAARLMENIPSEKHWLIKEIHKELREQKSKCI